MLKHRTIRTLVFSAIPFVSIPMALIGTMLLASCEGSSTTTCSSRIVYDNQGQPVLSDTCVDN